jgi:adenosylhomocysteinase
MDLSFAIQLLSVLHVAKNGKQLKPALYNIPQEIDDEVIRIKLDAMKVGIDVLTPEQAAYLGSM